MMTIWERRNEWEMWAKTIWEGEGKVWSLGKGKWSCEPIAYFTATVVTPFPSLFICLPVSYLTHNKQSASALGTLPPPPPLWYYTPVSSKYVHIRWIMCSSVLSTETTRSTGSKRLLPCRIFHSTSLYSLRASTPPKKEYLYRPLSRVVLFQNDVRTLDFPAYMTMTFRKFQLGSTLSWLQRNAQRSEQRGRLFSWSIWRRVKGPKRHWEHSGFLLQPLGESHIHVFIIRKAQEFFCLWWYGTKATSYLQCCCRNFLSASSR